MARPPRCRHGLLRIRLLRELRRRDDGAAEYHGRCEECRRWVTVRVRRDGDGRPY